MLALMKSLRFVDPWPIDYDFLLDWQQYMMFSMFLNSRNVFGFQPRSLSKQRYWWNLISLMSSILSRFLIKRKGSLEEKQLECTRFNGVTIPKRKLPGKLKAT